MPNRLTWTARARTDLIDIYISIGRERPDAAERYLDRIERKTETLRHHPRSGVRRPDIREGVRMLVDAPHLVLYRTKPDSDEGPIDEVEIVRVVDGRPELARLLI